mgnify:CR=1 FL=1
MSRQMKDSGIEWIGEIPCDWKVVRTKTYYRHHKIISGEDSVNYERLALTLKGVIKRSKSDSTGLQPGAFNGYQVLRKNELVFKLIDLENISTSRVGLSPYDGIVSPAYIVLEGTMGCNTKYGEYYFLSMWQRNIFNQMGDDGVRSSLNASYLLNIPYVFPKNDEQVKIVEFLDKKCAYIDSVIEKTKEAIEKSVLNTWAVQNAKYSLTAILSPKMIPKYLVNENDNTSSHFSKSLRRETFNAENEYVYGDVL